MLINLYEKFEIICQKKSIDLQIEMPEKCFFPLFCWRQRLIDWFLRTETLKP